MKSLPPFTPGSKLHPPSRYGEKKWIAAAAAAIFILLTGAVYLYRIAATHKGQNIALKNISAFDAPPGRNGAVLTLATETNPARYCPEWPSFPNENANVQKSDGQLSYQLQPASGETAKTLYNTISTHVADNSR